jgi:putative acetyltransferase
MHEINIRLATPDDEKYLIEWLKDDDVLKWFPMCNEREILDATRVWISYTKYNSVIMAEINGHPCGIANLYIQSSQKLKHQCLFAIIVDKQYRQMGVGTKLIKELIKMAKEKFNIEILHLEVYDGNPAMALYEKLGFKIYGFHKRFLKEAPGKYRGKYFMQQTL